MPLPHSVARFNKRVTNRLTGRLATRLPGFGVVVHSGRKTHRPYRTPINIFPRAGKYVVALTYGPDADWVRNVLASGDCIVETQGRTLRLAQPRIFHDERRRYMPPPARIILGLAHVSDFLELTPANVMDEISRKAQERGLTPEILDAILDEE